MLSREPLFQALDLLKSLNSKAPRLTEGCISNVQPCLQGLDFVQSARWQAFETSAKAKSVLSNLACSAAIWAQPDSREVLRHAQDDIRCSKPFGKLGKAH